MTAALDSAAERAKLRRVLGRLDTPGGIRAAWLVTGLATGWSALAAACLLWPGLGTANPDAHLPAGFTAHRGQFELLVLLPIAAVITAITGYHLTTSTRRRRSAAPRATASFKIRIQSREAGSACTSAETARHTQGGREC
jgi:hypothetical protein